MDENQSRERQRRVGNTMTKEEARVRLAMHAGKGETFTQGYRYAVKYGFPSLSSLKEQFDELFLCLKELLKEPYGAEQKELFADLSEIILGSILYINRQGKQYRVVGVFAEVLAETMYNIAEGVENPFEAFDAYPDNYDDILWEAASE